MSLKYTLITFQHYTHTHTHIYIYIYIYILLYLYIVFNSIDSAYVNSSSSLSSCRAASTNIPGPLSPLLPILQRLSKVFMATSHIAAICMFELVVLLLFGHMWGSIGVHHLWARYVFCLSTGHGYLSMAVFILIYRSHSYRWAAVVPRSNWLSWALSRKTHTSRTNLGIAFGRQRVYSQTFRPIMLLPMCT